MSTRRGTNGYALPTYASSQPRLRLRSSSISPKRSSRTWRIPFLRVRISRIRTILKPICILLAVLALVGFWAYEPHIELAFYRRSWIAREVERIEPLAGCFDPGRVSARYNVSQALYGPKRVDLHAGRSLRTGRDCYDFAGTIPASAGDATNTELVHYHTYWRTDLAPFGARQEYFLKSFFATQSTNTKLILWSNGDLSTSPIVQNWLRRYPERFSTDVARAGTLALHTPLEKSSLLDMADKRAWIDGDLVRLLVVWAYGGVWVDMDSLLTRDLAPLLDHEFVTQWDCYDKPYSPFNGALMHFHRHSSYLCEAFHIMATSPPPRASSTDWGALLYLKLYRRLLAAQIPPFKVLPWCFTEGRSCRLDNRLPDPFEGDKSAWRWRTAPGGDLDKTLNKVFGVHLHNQWEKAFPKGGWVQRLLLERFEEKLGSAART